MYSVYVRDCTCGHCINSHERVVLMTHVIHANVVYVRALVFMHMCKMSRTRNLSARDSQSLVKLHVSCTVCKKTSLRATLQKIYSLAV